MRTPARCCIPLLLVFGAACASTRVTVPRVAPAEVDLKQAKRLAIGGVAGPGGSDIAAFLTAAINATNHFEVVDRDTLTAKLEQHNVAADSRIADTSAVAVGKLVGSGGLLVGDIKEMSYNETMERQYAMCSNSGRQYECEKYTRTATAHCVVDLRILGTDSGQVLAARAMEFTEVKQEKKDGEAPKPFKADKAMLESCNKQIAKRFADVIAPHTVEVTVELLDDGDLPDLARGNEFAKAGNWRDAVKAYQAAVASLTDAVKPQVRAKALYDLGVAYSLSGEHDKGIAQLEAAYSLDPSERTAQQLTQAKQFKVDDAALAAQRAGNG